MKKQSYFVITSKSKYGRNEKLWFTDLDKAMEMFRLLIDGATVNIDTEYINSKIRHVEVGEADYSLENRVVDVYTRKEIEELEKQKGGENE